ncbi:MAG: hypothetical protein AAFU54_18845 [Chloroflexota bacterium]
MDFLIVGLVLISGGVHGYSFCAILIRVFRLNVNNRFFGEGDVSSIDRLMSNCVVLTFIVLSNLSWTDVFSDPLSVYAGSGLITVALTTVVAVVGKIIGVPASNNQRNEG